MIRRRPIPKTHFYPAQSLRYTMICNGAVRLYADGREVCQDSPAGWKEYSRRIDVMLARQENKCCLCKKRLHRNDATFEHQRRRGFAAAFRQDAILKLNPKTGKLEPYNGTAHWICNTEKQ
jgi:hypothetical protein